jgi:hypothetical protein
VSACFGKHHINYVNPIIDYTSIFITGGLTNARKWRFNLHLINTKDQRFPHRANVLSTPDAGKACRIQDQMINNDGCDEQQPRGFLGQ